MKKLIQTKENGPILFLLGNLAFATNGIWLKMAPAESSSFTLAAFRMIIGCLCLLLWLKLRKKQFSLKNWNWKYIFLYAVVLWGFQVFLFQSILTIGVAIGTVIAVGSTPLFAGLIQWIIQRKLPGKIWFISTGVAILGLVFLNVGNSGQSLSISELLLPVFSGFCSAVTLFAGPKLSLTHAPEEGVVLVTFIAALLFLPFLFFCPISWIGSPEGLCSVIMLGVVNCALAYSLILAGLKTTQPATASCLSLSEPMGAALIGIVFLGEKLTLNSALGIFLIFISVVLTLFVSSVKREDEGKAEKLC